MRDSAFLERVALVFGAAAAGFAAALAVALRTGFFDRVMLRSSMVSSSGAVRAPRRVATILSEKCTVTMWIIDRASKSGWC